MNVYVKEVGRDDAYCLVEDASRKSSVEALYETILDNGVVPSFVERVSFYGDGDMPIEEYAAGDTIPRSRGKPSGDKKTMAFTLDREIAEFIESLPEGERSAVVNEKLRNAFL